MRILKFNNPEILFILFLSFIYYYQFLINIQNSMIYNLQYFLYDYSFGFIKRGLIGEILSWISNYYSSTIIYILSFIFIIILSLIMTKIIDSINFKYKFFNYCLVCVLFFHPGLIKNLWFDIGRLDIFPILTCSLIILFSFSDKFILFKSVLLLLCPILLLIHEAVLVLWFPTIYVCWFLNVRNVIRKKQLLNITLVFIFLSIVLSVFIQLYGKLNVDFQTFKEYIESKTNVKIMCEKAVLSFKSFDPIDMFFINFYQFKFWIYGFTTLFLLIYIMQIFLSINCISFKKYKYYVLFPIIISFSIFFLGYDGLRWFSNIDFIVFMLLLSILVNNNDLCNFHSLKSKKMINNISFLIITLIILILFTHLGIMHDLKGYIPEEFK